MAVVAPTSIANNKFHLLIVAYLGRRGRLSVVKAYVKKMNRIS